MLQCPTPNVFKGMITNLTGRPVSTWGTLITPGNNSFPAYAEVLADTAYPCYLIEIRVQSNYVAATSRNTLLTLGFDFAGGTTYTDMEILHLLVSSAAALNDGGVLYRFPIFIPEGTAIAAKASVNNATVGTLRCGVRLFGRPTRPELVRYGRYVTSFGAVTATSRGTTITSGTTSEGAWTDLNGAADTTRPYWYWQCGMGVDDTTMTNGNIYTLDVAVGNASLKEIMFEDHIVAVAGTDERLVSRNLTDQAYYGNAATGQIPYGRMQCSGTADASLSMMAYGVGG